MPLSCLRFCKHKKKTEKSLTINDFNNTTDKLRIYQDIVKSKLYLLQTQGKKILWEDNYENIEGYVLWFFEKKELNDTINSTGLIRKIMFFITKKETTGRSLSGKFKRRYCYN